MEQRKIGSYFLFTWFAYLNHSFKLTNALFFYGSRTLNGPVIKEVIWYFNGVQVSIFFYLFKLFSENVSETQTEKNAEKFTDVHLKAKEYINKMICDTQSQRYGTLNTRVQIRRLSLLSFTIKREQWEIFVEYHSLSEGKKKLWCRQYRAVVFFY